ncbi:MAG: hypothetical protein JNG89_14665 [Planctomycetaceae bacterium]|nr:hypothetical protein [Planctomycetaceae bacterium]
MLSRIQRLFAWSLLAVYGGIALVGHGGMHLLHGDSHVHANSQVASDAHAHGHSHSHDSCCHHHHAGAEAPAGDPHSGGEHEHPHDGPGHDHDDCVICHHFAAKACLDAADLSLNLAAGVELIDFAAPEFASGEDRYVLPIRGPPLSAC